MNTLREQLDELPQGEARAYVESEMAALLIERGDYGQALVHLGGVRRATSEPRLRERVDLLTGLALLKRGEVERAEPHLERQLESARERRDLEGEARALLHLGEIYRRRGEAARSSRALERARFYFESHPDAAALAATYTSRAELALAAGELERGEALALRAAELAESVTATAAEAAALVTLGRLRGQRGAAVEAEAALGRAIELLSTANMPRELAEAYFAYGHVIGDAGDERDAARVGSAATFIARAQELFREHGALADLERVRQAFQRFGRRATDQVAAAELRELGDGLRASRLDVTRQVHKLVDAVEQGIGRVDAELPSLARGKLHAISRSAVAAERAVSAGVEALADAEARLVAALQSMVVERESVRTLLDLCRALNSIDHPGRVTSEICKMAAQLTGADRALVALVEGERLELRATLRMPGVATESGWREAMDGVLAGGGARLVGARAGVAPEPSDPREPGRDGKRPARDPEREEPRLGHALVTPLRLGERLLGVVYVDKELCGGLFTLHDLELLATFCGQAATILQSAELAETSRRALATRTAALDAVADGLLVFDGRGRLLALHGAAARSLGVTVGANLGELPALGALAAGAESSVNPLAIDGNMVQLGGNEYLVSARRPRNEGGDGVALVVTLTALARAQALAQRLVGAPARASFADLVGRAPSLRRQLQRAEVAARGDGGVLVIGEPGSGKTLLAQALHQASSRASGPFVVVDCAAVPRALLEAELFGCSGGPPGKLELAAGGTLLLEALGELPIALQIKLAGALQERRIRRAGGTREAELDARLVATTSRPLDAEASTDGEAGGDGARELLARLGAVPIALPPLRERPGDVPLLLAHQLGPLAARFGKRIRALAPHVLDAFVGYDWPGNVRELERVLEAEVYRAADDETVLDRVPLALRARSAATPATVSAVTRTLEENEKELLIYALGQHAGSIPDVARQLGISRGTVYNKLRRFALDPDRFRRG